MRSLNRIHPFLKTIEGYINAELGLTIGKLLNIARDYGILYFKEEDEILETLKKSLNIKLDLSKLDEPLANPYLIEIEKLWKKLPDMRFSQLICNLTEDDAVFEAVSDEQLTSALLNYYIL